MVDGQLHGIIPARAGFTRRRRDGVGRRRDHPRSRGVYQGLGVVGPASEDHPRSRGVYTTACSQAVPGAGSSPLARGLRDAPHPAHRGVGIIPARAGFTMTRALMRSPPWDHPRSRGVYPYVRPRWIERVGSSPLARGLQGSWELEFGYFGIIPARAGFTRSVTSHEFSLRDHPRSRGGYITLSANTRLRAGSSPLARGLRRRHAATAPGTRIIPARAGFTRRSHHRMVGGGDHPRSRGVYGAPSRIRCADGGSSPLARGLPADHHRGGRSRRIIPARAGFTTGSAHSFAWGAWIIPARAGFTRLRRARPATGRDHPRSRGVYRTSGHSGCTAPGSSPLARGLPRAAGPRPS